jgi:outer membrane protein assembly factor BamB
VDALALDANGDVIAGGTIVEPKEGDDFVVMRLDGQTGRRRWRAIVRGRASQDDYEEAYGLAVAPSGDVVAAGSVEEMEGPGHYGNFAVVTLNGATGAERWRFVVDGAVTGSARSVAVDTHGDVVAAGDLEPDMASTLSSTVVKLAGPSGTVVWQQPPAHVVNLSSIAVDGEGDVLLAGTADGSDGPGSEFGVLKLSGVSGDTQWIARESIDNQRWQEALHVVVDGVDGVFAAGITDDGSGEPGGADGEVLTVVRLDPATGATRWRYRIGGAGNGAFVYDLVLGPAGTILAAGYTNNPVTCEDGFVVALDRVSGEPRWSQTFDGSLTAATCHPECPDEGPPVPCPAVDDDYVSNLAVDAASRIFVAGYLVNGTEHRPRFEYFLRQLASGNLWPLSDPGGIQAQERHP